MKSQYCHKVGNISNYKWPQYIYRWNFIFVWLIVCTVKIWYIIKWVIWCDSTFHAADVQDIHHNCHKQSNYILSSYELLNCANIHQVWVHMVRERIAFCKSSRRQSFSKLCTVNSSRALNKHLALIQNCETTQTFHWSNIVSDNNNNHICKKANICYFCEWFQDRSGETLKNKMWHAQTTSNAVRAYKS